MLQLSASWKYNRKKIKFKEKNEKSTWKNMKSQKRIPQDHDTHTERFQTIGEQVFWKMMKKNGKVCIKTAFSPEPVGKRKNPRFTPGSRRPSGDTSAPSRHEQDIWSEGMRGRTYTSWRPPPKGGNVRGFYSGEGTATSLLRRFFAFSVSSSVPIRNTWPVLKRKPAGTGEFAVFLLDVLTSL